MCRLIHALHNKVLLSYCKDLPVQIYKPSFIHENGHVKKMLAAKRQHGVQFELLNKEFISIGA